MNWFVGVLMVLAILPVILWVISRHWLLGENLTAYNEPRPDPIGPDKPSPEIIEANRTTTAMQKKPPTGARIWGRADSNLMLETLFGPGDPAVEIRAVMAQGVKGEWNIAPGADPDRRMLYLHGGSFSVGNPKTHRSITTTLSRETGLSVLSLDYSLMPEASYAKLINDIQTGYRWIIDNGPDGPAPVKALFVAGDSAGGTATFVVLAWARDIGLRPADAAIVMSGSGDMLMGKAEAELAPLDVQLGKLMGPIARIPDWLFAWMILLTMKQKVKSPLVSPAQGDLANLPPTLVQASESEMLLFPALRWVNRAVEAGTDARIQIWRYPPHVWQAYKDLPEAKQAIAELVKFIKEHSPD